MKKSLTNEVFLGLRTGSSSWRKKMAWKSRCGICRDCWWHQSAVVIAGKTEVCPSLCRCLRRCVEK